MPPRIIHFATDIIFSHSKFICRDNAPPVLLPKLLQFSPGPGAHKHQQSQCPILNNQHAPSVPNHLHKPSRVRLNSLAYRSNGSYRRVCCRRLLPFALGSRVCCLVAVVVDSTICRTAATAPGSSAAGLPARCHSRKIFTTSHI